MKPIIFHVDVNNAFLSWEAVYRLKHLGGRTDLREQLCVVGGDASKRHGIVLAKSLSAKACGIHTGESLMEARQKCPDCLWFLRITGFTAAAPAHLWIFSGNTLPVWSSIVLMKLLWI